MRRYDWIGRYARMMLLGRSMFLSRTFFSLFPSPRLPFLHRLFYMHAVSNAPLPQGPADCESYPSLTVLSSTPFRPHWQSL
jgi:hypothetical protein